MTDETPAISPELIDEAVALAERWIDATNRGQTKAEAATTGQLAALVSDADGLDLALTFVDQVARPEDAAVAARELSQVSAAKAASFLSVADRTLLGVGAKVAPLAPKLVIPMARMRLRQLVGHLVVDARDPHLADHLRKAREDGFKLNINLLGEAVLGEAEAASRAERTRKLLERPDVDYVSIKVSSLVSQISTWDTPGTVKRVLERLRPLYRAAMASTPHAFVNLDMEEYRDLDLTMAVFMVLMSEPEFADLQAGIVLQGYLPDTPRALEKLIEFAKARVANGGAPLKVRLVKGANLSMETVEAEMHDWALAPYDNKPDVDANYLRLVERTLREDCRGVLRVGVASHNLYAVAFAHLLAAERGMSDQLDIEMLQGMSPSQARAVRDVVGSVLLYTPVVAPEDFDVAVSYLVRRLEENAQPQNFLHALFANSGGTALPDQEERFRTAVAAIETTPKGAQRTTAWADAGDFFVNAVDSDPSLTPTRAWAREQLGLERPEPTSPILTTPQAVGKAVAKAGRAGDIWATWPAAKRAAVLRHAADELELRRGELVTAMSHEGGKTIGEADPEISEAVDFARYYADRAENLEVLSMQIDGTTFTPDRVVLITPPWNFPVAIPIGGVLAALAAGSGVLIKPAGPVPCCTEVAAEALQVALDAAVAPEGLLQVVRTADRDTARALVAHKDVETVVLTGSIETARLFKSFRDGRPRGPRVFAETSGKNAMIITPAADYDLAVADTVKSAFGHAGQKCSAASLVILVGSAGRSERLKNQLVDAVESLRVGWPSDRGVIMGPVITPPEDKLERAMTTLEPGESWLVKPRQLDETGRLWSPGLKDGVSPGSFFHLTECFGPVLGIMRAKTLAEAIDLANAVDFGLTSGLHSLDEAEIDYWREHIEVGNAYINRGTTGAIVQRQPFGGWKDSSVGPGAKAGGPNYVAQLGTWSETKPPINQLEPSPTIRTLLGDFHPLLSDADDRAWLRAAAGSDAAAWTFELSQEVDPTALASESNIFRYRPLPELWVRVGAASRLVDVARMVLATTLVGTKLKISAHPDLKDLLDVPAFIDHVEAFETDGEFIVRAELGEVSGRVRLLPGADPDTAAQLGMTDVDMLDGAVLANGRRELLSTLREQAISMTMHRFGHLKSR